MSLPTESVTLPGSGLVFVNYYEESVTPAYRSAIIAAEHELQSRFTNPTTVGIDFDLADLGEHFSGENSFQRVRVSYDSFVAALRSHGETADDFTALSGLPFFDPSAGVGFSIASSQARILGLTDQTNDIDDFVTLNSRIPFTFGQDAIGVLEHEITEGVFGRVASLGLQATRWAPLDLFRFTATGQHDYTGGRDGITTYFGIDGGHVTGPAFHNAIDATGHDDGFDLGDWEGTRGDAFGPGGFSAGVITPTDLQVLDVLGWRPASVGAYIPAPDLVASGLTGSAQAFGQVAIGEAAFGVLEQAGDRDWFRVNLEAGQTYTFDLVGRSGGGTLADAFLRLRDANGVQLAANDDVISGADADSRITFKAAVGGVYYLEAGSFVDGYTGSYRLDVAHAASPTIGADALAGLTGGDSVGGLAGNDTITAGDGSNVLRGDEGDDVIVGGGAFDDINGNMGNDTLFGGDGDDWVVGGKDNDVQFGNDGADVVLGNLGDDSLSGDAGADIVRGGKGNDVLSGGSGDDFVSGDLGDDTITGGSGADVFHSFEGAGLDRALDFNASEGDRVRLDPGTTYTVAQVGADTVVTISGGGELVLVGVSFDTLPADWIFVG